MAKRISAAQQQRIFRLADQRFSYRRIASEVRVSLASVGALLRGRKQGFSSIKAYQEQLALQRINPETGQHFTSLQEYSARKRRNPSTGEPFHSEEEYQHFLLQRRRHPTTRQRFVSPKAYRDYLAQQRINPETDEHFPSRYAYQRYQQIQQQKRPENQALRILIKRRLEELNHNQSWLAQQLDISDGEVSYYAQGKRLPPLQRFSHLFTLLQVPYRTLEDLLAAREVQE